MKNLVDDQSFDELDIAIIGMAGRFPGARNCDEFWENLRAGRESIARFSEDELLNAGLPASAIHDPFFVPAHGALAEADRFDALFFGFSPREAEVLDPQQRVLLECAWHALEDAGYDPHRYEGLIGIFAGVGLNTYLLHHLQPNRDQLQAMDDFQIMILNDKDTLPTRISYKLNLRGPAVNVQTSCSTGLVAVHLACNSLLNFECDMALAGAVAVKFPQVTGYRFQPGGILSPDGRCRAFDEQAAGTVGGSGGGTVVLKRIADAIADGDVIRAVVRGSAINNDGARKVSYTAPSVGGQSEVIAAAQIRARVSPDSISFVEAHGTATPVGDPIEVAALTRAFRLGTDRSAFCAIGSVKSNIGHLDTAAGVAGLIKATLALEHNELPPSLYFEQPNPKLELDRSPFYVSARLQRWPSSAGPRRAGVSSFGVGGTNAHVVLQEAPPRSAPSASLRPAQILTWSAKTRTALDAVAERLVAHIGSQVSAAELPDAAFTLHMGRAAFPYRQALIVRSATEVQAPEDARHFISSTQPVAGDRPVVFLFPGQGSQRPGVARSLYAVEPTFRSWIDCGADTVKAELGCDLRDLLLASPDDEHAAAMLRQTNITQPALFIYEYALASLWQEWGVQPSAVMGHSAGAYTAACLSGIMSFEDALLVVTRRGALIAAQPAGAMIAISCGVDQLRELLPDEVSIAAVNASQQCVASGPVMAVATLERALEETGISYSRLRTSHAFHSPMMTPVAASFKQLMASVALHEAQVPVMSDITGGWLLPQQATNTDYWAEHLTAPVRFADGVEQIARTHGSAIWLEVGPGGALMALARRQLAGAGHVFVAPQQDGGTTDASEALLAALARIWVESGRVDWKGFHQHEARRRVRLPLYPFERQRYFIDAAASQSTMSKNGMPGSRQQKERIEEWFYCPSWKQKYRFDTAETVPKTALVFADETGIGQGVADALSRRGTHAIIARRGPAFARRDDEFTLEEQPESYVELLRQLEDSGEHMAVIVYCWPLDVHAAPLDPAAFEASQRTALFPLVELLRALDQAAWTKQIQIFVVTENAYCVSGGEVVSPELGPVLALAKVAAQEYANIQCVAADISRASAQPTVIAEQLASEIVRGPLDAVVAFRGDLRWAQTFDSIPAPQPTHPPARIRAGGTYLILGGRGRIGLELAAILARVERVNIILADLQSGENPAADAALRELRRSGARVDVRCVDIADVDALRELVRATVMEFGRLDGVIHAAGCPEELTPVIETTPDVYRRHFAAKVYGTLALERSLADQDVSLVLLLSSLSSILGGLGHAAYAASNGFLDAFAQSRRRSCHHWLSVNVETWNLGQGSAWADLDGPGISRLDLAMTREETTDVLARILSSEHRLPQLIVSSGNLHTRLSKWVSPVAPAAPKATGAHARPDLSTPYVAPQVEIEQDVARIWSEVLGIGRIGVQDSFFELGGDSLMAAQIVARTRDYFRVELPLRKLFETPTIQGVCGVIAAAQQEAATLKEIEQLLAEIEALGSGDSQNGEAARL